MNAIAPMIAQQIRPEWRAPLSRETIVRFQSVVFNSGMPECVPGLEDVWAEPTPQPTVEPYGEAERRADCEAAGWKLPDGNVAKYTPDGYHGGVCADATDGLIHDREHGWRDTTPDEFRAFLRTHAVKPAPVALDPLDLPPDADWLRDVMHSTYRQRGWRNEDTAGNSQWSHVTAWSHGALSDKPAWILAKDGEPITDLAGNIFATRRAALAYLDAHGLTPKPDPATLAVKAWRTAVDAELADPGSQTGRNMLIERGNALAAQLEGRNGR